jgi:hypothetical protein
VSEDTRQLLLLLRRALIAALNALDDALGLPRCVQTRKSVDNARRSC